MLVLGLDPSLSGFGWALVEIDSLTEAISSPARGTWRSKKSDFSSFIDRYLYLREKIRDLLLLHKIEKVGIESPTFGQQASSQMHSLFTFSCEALRENSLDTVLIGNTQTKAWVRRYLDRPSGWTISKVEMQKAAKMITGDPKNWTGDSADAFWAAYLAGRFWLLQMGRIDKSSLTSYEKEAFLKIDRPKKGKKAGTVNKRGLVYRENDRFFLWSQEDKGFEKKTTKKRGRKDGKE